MMLIYYCYSCNEFFKISSNKVKNASDIICPCCSSFDTEPAPEEKNSSDINKYVNADKDLDVDDNEDDTEYDSYIREEEENNLD